MKFRFGILALTLFLSQTTLLFAIPVDANDRSSTATVLVWVRNGRGAPVPGLTADDFAITENGVPDRVLKVRNLVPENRSSQSTASPRAALGGAKFTTPASSNGEAEVSTDTQVLLIISPMAARGRRACLRDAIRLLEKPVAANWRLGLLDDEGTFVPFDQSAGQMRGILEKLARRISAPQYQPFLGGTWHLKVVRAIRELGTLPGRHVIVFVSDYESKSVESFEQNPTLLRIGPAFFIDSAVNAQAAMYTVQGEGGAVAVPFGGAASSNSYGGSGQDVANGMMQDIVRLGAMRSNLLQAADETGGLPANDLEEAFKRIDGDAAGYYLVSFETPPHPGEGSWRPFSISIRLPQLTVKGPRFYLAAHEPVAGPLPADMKFALENVTNRTGLNVLAQAWLFPNQGSVHWATFAADVRFDRDAPAPGSRVRIHAELINDSIGGVTETWYEEREWPEAGNVLPLHWQREAYLYPGSYLLRVTAMDTASGRISEGTDSFIARPLDVSAFRFSAIVLADGCLPEREQQTMRHNLFDPIRWEGCKLAPSAAGHFRADQTPLLLLRIYPPNAKLAEVVKRQWSFYAVVDDADDKAVELQISDAEVRGMAVTGKLPLGRWDLMPGLHDLKVLLTIPDSRSNSQVLPLHAKFTVEP